MGRPKKLIPTKTKRVKSLKQTKKFDIKAAELKHKVADKLKAAGRNPDGSFAKGNEQWKYRHGKKFWQFSEMLGRERYFKTPVMLMESFTEYCDSVQENPWYRNELVKSGDFAGMIMPVPTVTPYSIEGFCGFVGLSSVWYRNTRKNFENKLEKNPEDEDARLFLAVFQIMDDAIRRQKFDGAAIGAFNANLISRDLGLAEKSEIEVGARKQVADAFPFADDHERLENRRGEDEEN